jgi:hypothetical protein
MASDLDLEGGFMQHAEYDLLRIIQAGVKIALAAAHFHGFGVALAGPWDTVEKFPLCPLRPQIGPQTHRFGAIWSFWSPIRSHFQLSADFFNRLNPSTHSGE